MSFSDFQSDIAKAMEPLLRRALDRVRENRSTDTPTPFHIDKPLIDPTPKHDLSPDERFLSESFHGFTEISGTFDRLLDTEVYLRRFPFSGTRITRERYLRQHIEAYFHETYILRERLKTYAKRTTRFYKKTAVKPLAVLVEKKVTTIVSAFDDVVAVRSRHVHEYRFEETRLQNLASLELIERNSNDPMWAAAVKENFPKVRKYWVEWTGDMNEVIDELIDRYFGHLHPLLFDGHTFRPSGAV